MTEIDTRSYRVAVIGGGITGLATAFYLGQQLREDKPAELHLFEQNNRLGGVINTKIEGDCLLEGGPDSIFTAKKEALSLIDELGLTKEIIQTNNQFRRSLMASAGSLKSLPDGFVMLAPSEIMPFVQNDLLSFKGKLRAFMDLLILPRFYGEEESVAEFVDRRFGRELLEKIVQPMVGGIYVGDVEKLSAQSTLPQFVELERTAGSIIGGLIKRRLAASKMNGDSGVSGARYGMFVSLRGGLSSLVDCLEQKTRNCQFHLNTSVESVIQKENKWSVSFKENREELFDYVVLALPSHHQARLLKDAPCQLVEEIRSIPCASSVVVNFIYSRRQTEYDFNGFGFVVPALEKRSIIAGSFSSIKYEGRCPEEKVLVRAFLGGVLQSDLLKLSDQELIDLAHNDLADYLGFDGKPEYSWLSRWDYSMPQYLVGHSEKVERIFSEVNKIPGLALAGNSFKGVGIPDCIASAKEAANKVAEKINS